jgi:hypothetical protein
MRHLLASLLAVAVLSVCAFAEKHQLYLVSARSEWALVNATSPGVANLIAKDRYSFNVDPVGSKAGEMESEGEVWYLRRVPLPADWRTKAFRVFSPSEMAALAETHAGKLRSWKAPYLVPPRSRSFAHGAEPLGRYEQRYTVYRHTATTYQISVEAPSIDAAERFLRTELLTKVIYGPFYGKTNEELDIAEAELPKWNWELLWSAQVDVDAESFTGSMLPIRAPK